MINMEYHLLIACTDRQCLTYCNDKLKDRHTLEFYGIGEGALIQLSQIGTAFPIHIRLPTGETIRILIEGINTIGSLKSWFHAWVPRGKGAEFWTKIMEQ